MVKLSELLAFFEEIAPSSLAEEYDNVGLLVEGDSTGISTLYVTLDTDEEVVEEAALLGAELIVSHHPIMFKPVNRLTEEEGGQRTIRALIKKGIGLFALHTNFDSAQGGLCDVFAEVFGPFASITSFSGEKAGIGRVATLQEPVTMEQLLARAKAVFCPGGRLRYVGHGEETVSRIAFCNGGGGDMVYDAYGLGADVYISGDFKHHHACFAKENSMNVIEIDHYDAEIGFCKLLKEKLEDAFFGRLSVVIKEEAESPWKQF